MKPPTDEQAKAIIEAADALAAAMEAVIPESTPGDAYAGIGNPGYVSSSQRAWDALDAYWAARSTFCAENEDK